MKSKTGIEFEKSSGNVFADLGLEDADELFAHAQKGIRVVKLIKSRGLKKKEASALLAIAQSDVSSLLNAHFDQFAADELLEFIRVLEHKVMIPMQEVAVGT